MHRVIAMAQVRDAATWEESIRANTTQLRAMTVTAVYFGSTGENRCATLFEVADLGKFIQGMQSQEMVEYMEINGFIREHSEICILDNEVDLSGS